MTRIGARTEPVAASRDRSRPARLPAWLGGILVLTALAGCETVPGVNHFTVLAGLADRAGRLHDLALRLLGLR